MGRGAGGDSEGTLEGRLRRMQARDATSRRDRRPAGGAWQGVDTRTGSVASAIWVDRSAWDEAVVFIAIDGESLGDCSVLSLERDPYREDGGER